MRVALVHPYSWPTVRRGGERYLHDLARWLTDHGHQVDVITGSSEGESSEERDGVCFIRLPLQVPHRLERRGVTALDTFGITALRRLTRTRYDVVHSLVPSGGLAAALVLQPSVYTVLGHPSRTNPPAHRWSRALFAQGVRRTRVPVALSRSAASGVEALTGRRPLVLPPGVRTGEFLPKDGVGAGPVRLLFNGFASDPRKRLPVLLNAMPRVLEVHPGTRLVLGGGGDAGPALAQLDPGIRRSVEAVVDDIGPGSLSDVPARYREATVSVLPSVDEAFGLVLVESLACGTPVVCSRSGGMPEIVSEQVGRLSDADDAPGLATAILEAVCLAAQPTTIRECVQRARTWDWETVGPRHERAYALARA